MSTPRHDRLLDLLADRALEGLGAREQIELAELMLEFPGEDATSFDRAAAAAALASLDVYEVMPASLAARIEASADGAVAAASKHLPPPAMTAVMSATLAMPDRPMPAPPAVRAPAPQAPVVPYASVAPAPAPAPPPSNVVPFAARKAEPSRASRALAVSGWIAAAACFLLAVGAFVYRSRPGPTAGLPTTTAPTVPSAPPTAQPPSSVASATPAAPASESVASMRERLLALKNTARAEWTATKDPAAKGASGDVVWNPDEQRGVMRFRGLAKNEATRAQYQLWIFDKARDDKYPVDGGVFDVDAETGDVVVAIKAKLPVATPTLFAVTVEKPGGVVVSKRERIVVTAKLPTG